MGDTIDTAITRFEVAADQAIEEIKKLKGVEKELADETERTTAAGKKHEEGLGSLTNWAREHALEKRAELGVLRSVSLELGDNLPHSANLALTGMRLLGSGIGPLGLAFAGVSIAIEALTSHFEKADEAAKKMMAETEKSVKEGAEKIRAELNSILEGWDKSTAQAGLGSAEKMRDDLLRSLEKTGDALQKELDEAEKKLEEWRNKEGDDGLIGKLVGERDAIRAKIKQAGEDAREALEQADLAIDEERKGKALKEEEAFDLKVNEERRKAEDKRREDIKKIALEAATEREKIVLQADAKLAEAQRLGQLGSLRKLAEEKLALLKAYDAKEADEETKHFGPDHWEREHKSAAADLTLATELGRLKEEQEKAVQEDLTRIVNIAAAERAAIAKREREVQVELGRQLESAYKKFAVDAASAFGDALKSCKAYDDAMRASGQASKASQELTSAAVAKWTQDTLAGIAQQAAVKALFDLAEGISTGAPNKFASAALFGAIAGGAGVGAYAIGQTRGLTADEAAQARSGGSALSQAGGAGPGGSSSGGGSQQQSRIYVLPTSPYFTQEMQLRDIQRAINLAQRLDYRGTG